MDRLRWFQLIIVIGLISMLSGCNGSTPAATNVPTTESNITVTNIPTLADSSVATSIPTKEANELFIELDDSLFGGVGKKGVNIGNKTPFVIIFEESHDSRVGQVEIAIMLNRLYWRHGVRHLALEGAVVEEKAPNANWFHALPDVNVRLDIAVQLLEQGEISAAEFFAMAYPDVQLHPIEKTGDRDVTMSDDASVAPIGYLYFIAVSSLTNDQIAEVNKLEGMEAVEYVINSNSWTKERYEFLIGTKVIPQIEEMITLAEELESKAKEVNADVSDYAAGLQEYKDFFSARGDASVTMVDFAVDIIGQYPNSPLAMEIGAAHTNYMTELLGEKAISFAVFSPLALESENTASLYTIAYNRKLERISIDPAGALGAYLDGRLKPPTVLNEEWFQLKAQIMYAGTVIARAAAGGGKPPFGLDKKALGISDDGLFDLDLTKLVVEPFDKDGKEFYAVKFPIKLVKENKTLWMKVVQLGTVPNPIDNLADETTLEEILMPLVTRLRQEEEVDDSEAEKLENEHSSENPAIVPLSVDVKGVISDNENAITTAQLGG